MGINIKKFIRKILKIILLATAVLVLCLAAIFFLFRTETGINYLAGMVEEYLHYKQGIQVKIGRVTGNFPYDLRCKDISFADNEGDWLFLKKIAIDWRPSSLIKKCVDIKTIQAEDVRFIRLPHAMDNGKAERGTEPYILPAIPVIFIEELKCGEFHLGPSLLGVEAVFSIDGQIRTESSGEGFEWEFLIKRTDKPDSFLEIRGSIRGDEPVLRLDMEARESNEDLIKGLLGIGETGILSVSLSGEGPVSEWRGRLIATAEKLAGIESSFMINISDRALLRAEGKINLLENRIPEPFLPLINARPIRFNFDVSRDGKESLIINHVRIATDGSRFEIQGKFNFEERYAEAVVGLDIKDLSRFEVFTSGGITGNLSLKGDVAGSFNRPRGTFYLSVSDPTFADISAKRMAAEIIIETGHSPPNIFQSVRIKGKGDVDDPVIKDFSSRVPFKKYKWSLDAYFEKGMPINIRSSEITAENLFLGYSGILDPISQSMDGNLKMVIDDLGLLSGILGNELMGRINVAAEVKGDLLSRDIQADLDIHGKGLKIFPPVISPLITPEISYKGRVALEKGKQLRLWDTAIRSGSMEIKGAGLIDLVDLNINIDALLEIPGLSVLSPAIGKDMDGILRADLNIQGAFDDPKINAHVIVDEMTFEGVMFRRALLVSNVKNLFDNPKGEFKLDLEKNSYNIKAGGRFTLEYPDLLVRDLSLSLPDTSLTGEIEADLSSAILKGSLKGQSSDLNSLSQIFGEQIKGRAEVDILLRGGQKGQDLVLKLHGEQIESGFARVDELNIGAELQDVFDSLTGNAVIESSLIRRRELSLERLRVEIGGGMNDARFRLVGIGGSPQKFNIETSGKYYFSGGDVALKLDHLQGDYAGYPVFLRKALIIRKVSKDIEIEDLDLGLDKGSLTGSGKISGESVRFEGRLDGIPVEALHGFGIPDLEGTAVADVSVSGTLKKPAGDIEIRIMKIVSRDPSLQHLPPFDLLVQIDLKDDRLNADVLLSGWAEKPFSAMLEIPAEISFLPPSFSLGKNRDIHGEMSAEMSISFIQSFFKLEDHIMEGGLSAFLTLEGSLENPQINGRIGLFSGYYENMIAGLILKEIDVDIAVRGDQLVLIKADAKDSGKGMVQATGRMFFRPGEEFPFLLNLILKDILVTDRDYMTITTDGALGISGDMSGGIISGSLNIKDAELLIPNRLPSIIKDMDVIEINKPEKLQEIEQKNGKKSSYTLDLNLDVEAPGKVFIRGRGIDSEWKSRLNILGATEKPLIKGDLSVIRGAYNLFGKPFSLTQGIITFRGNSPPDPDIMVMGEHKMSDMVARIGISGSQSELDIIMESDPYLPQDEILSRVLFGRSVANNTPIQALKLAQALNNLRGGGSDILNFFDRTRSFLGLDQLEVKQTGEGTGQTSVSVGKYVGESVYLEVEKGLGSDSGKVSVEVDLTPNLTLESEAGMDTGSAVGINWKWDY